MKRVVLISCSKTKREGAHPAYRLYDVSELFSKSYRYAKTISDEIYILSSKYGLIKDTDQVECYDFTLKGQSRKANQIWANQVISSLKNKFDLTETHFVILAGKDYYQNIIPYLQRFSLPLGHMKLGERLSELDRLLKNPGNDKLQENIAESERIRFSENMSFVDPAHPTPIKQTSTKQAVKEYIQGILNYEKAKGSQSVVLVSGQIHKALNLKNCLPTVCNAMYDLMKSSDEVLSTTPSGLSSTITIRFGL